MGKNRGSNTLLEAKDLYKGTAEMSASAKLKRLMVKYNAEGTLFYLIKDQF